MKAVPKSMSVLMPPVKTDWVNWGLLSFRSLTLTTSSSKLSSEGSNVDTSAGRWWHSSVAFTTSVCTGAVSRSRGLGVKVSNFVIIFVIFFVILFNLYLVAIIWWV